ncbi:Uncharacterised protein [Staphylococcus gallinarum]|uniref:Uncharacterized protein n=1 Tax=Staphylococcus gallinarum TaxID=1293 RepID=A0A380F9B3_STAGA|nr:Uncharacterised protein [Staphylococcus gallinarum]
MGIIQGLASIFEDLIPIWGIGVIVFAVVYIFFSVFRSEVDYCKCI